MYSGVGPIRPIRTIAAHIPQQGLIPLPPRVPLGATETRPRVRAPLVTPPGESPYAARIRNAGAVMRRRRMERRQALGEALPQTLADANAFQDMVYQADASMLGPRVLQQAFTDAGQPVDETYAINQLVIAHQSEIAANVQAATDAAAAGRQVPMLDSNGRIVMVDVGTDPGVAAAAVAQAAGNPVAVSVGSPLAAAALAVTPAQAAAAAVWGQSQPNPQTAILAQAQANAAQPTVPAWVVPVLVVAGVWFFYGRKRGK